MSGAQGRRDHRRGERRDSASADRNLWQDTLAQAELYAEKVWRQLLTGGRWG